MNDSLPARPARGPFLRGTAVAAVLACPFPRPAAAAADAVPLDQVMVTATRTPASVAALGSSVDVLTGADLAREQVASLGAALGEAAGAPLFAGGAPGAASSVFLRGANSNQALFLVDGLRISDSNTDYAVTLGGAGVAAADRLEIARGPQSTLYGGEALGGVVALSLLKGAGAPSGTVALAGGSFGTIDGSVGAQGTSGAWAYDVALSGQQTDNQRRNNAFTGTTLAARLDRQVGSGLAVGATFRWFGSRYGSPGDRFTNDPDNVDREQNALATLFADYAVSPAWSGHVTLGGQDRRFVSTNPTPGQPTQITTVTNRRAVLDWQNTVALGAGNRLTAGITGERNQTRNDGFGDIDRAENLLAFFAQDEWSPAAGVHLTGGLRSEDYDTFGRATTGRATAAWRPGEGRIKLRASYGTGFRSPSFLDLYGQSAFYAGNPDLQPERAHGWDAGADLDFRPHDAAVSATWFDTDFRDLIVYDFGVFPGTTRNVDRARTRGLELALRAEAAGRWQLRLAYTYLEADDLTAHTRLLRRPRHLLTADAWRDLGHGLSLGAGVRYVAGRQDVDAQTFATVDAPDYAVARAYAAWAATPRLTVKVRAENLFNRRYEEVNGYPALGAGVFGGVEWKF